MFDPVLTVASADDAALLAGLHWRSWREAYRDLLPARYLEEQASGEMVEKWQQRMHAAAGEYRVCIARVDGVAAGWPGQALLLHVLDGNLPARAIYRRLGGIETKLPDETMAGDVVVPVSRVTWQDVPALLARLQS